MRYVIRKQTVLLQGEHTSEQFYDLDSQLHAIWFTAIGMDRLWRAIQKAQTNYTRFRMLDLSLIHISPRKTALPQHGFCGIPPICRS